eukprot:8948535-Alexandrium_andersonii.AAC.1
MLRTAKPVEAGQLRSGDGRRPDDAVEQAPAWRVCRSSRPEATCRRSWHMGHALTRRRELLSSKWTADFGFATGRGRCLNSVAVGSASRGRAKA